MDLLGYTLMIPLLPAVAERYGASDLKVGALLSVPAFCSVIAAPLWGKASDRIGRKRVLLASQVFSLCGYLLLALSHSLFWIFISRAISGFGAGNLSAVQSYIADVTEPEQRNEAFALYGVVFGAGFIVGPVASGFLVRHGIAIPFFIAAGLEVFNLLLTSAFVPWQTRSRRTRTSFAASLQVIRRPNIRRLFIRQFLFIFAVVYFLGSFALYIRSELHTTFSAAGWLLAVAGVVGAFVQIFLVAPLASRLGERIVAQIGLVLQLFAYVGLAFVPNISVFLAVLIVWAAGAAMVAPTLMSLMATRAPTAERGAILGVGDSFNNVALIFAPLVGSAIVGLNPRFLGLAPAVAMLLALWIGSRPMPR